MTGNIHRLDVFQKRKLLIENGWETLWNEDNWIKTSWKDDPRINIDMAGYSLDAAHRIAINEVLKGMYKFGSVYIHDNRRPILEVFWDDNNGVSVEYLSTMDILRYGETVLTGHRSPEDARERAWMAAWVAADSGFTVEAKSE